MYHLKPVRPVIFVLVTLSLVWPVPAQTTGGRRIVIKTMIGEVKIRRGTSATWQDARVKMAIKEQDAVRCFVESEAELETDDGSVIKIGENSTLEMTAFSGAKGGATNTSVKILSGNVLSDIKKLTGKQSKFEFEMPTASASIRGTRVGFDVSSDQTDIRVYEGTVYVVPAGAREGAEVNANQMTSVAKGQRRVQVQKLQEPETKPEPVKKADSTAVPSDSVKADTAATGRGPGADTSAAADQEAKADTTVQSPAALNLAIMTPEEKAAVKPGEQVTVTGKVSPASATVSVNGKSVTVSSSGDFRTIVMAAQEPGEMDVTVDAAFSGQSKSVTRGITVTMPAAAGPFTFAVTTPSNGQVFAKPVVPVSGTVTPGAEVSVSGIKLTVLSNGTFSVRYRFPTRKPTWTWFLKRRWEATRKPRCGPSLMRLNCA